MAAYSYGFIVVHDKLPRLIAVGGPGQGAAMRKTLLCMTSALILTVSKAAQAGACSDIALVLALDSSDSIDDDEYAF